MAEQDSTPQPNDMNDLIAQAAQVQAELQKAQEEILATNVEGSAGNGLVKVTMTGGAELVDLQIDKSVVDPEDIDTLQDLVMGAFKDAHAAAGKLAQEKIGPLSQGMGGQGGPSMDDMFGGNF
ncbi:MULTISPECIES: YbaB/EbfC family nucleoid-associated protein [Corynebacterium]|jgi:DNA-binding protein, ybaB/ebfC family|uniref:Nucleoid-associated protein QPX58_07765 n=1 Tax=Corynebacterium accolens TaxID=38284 RepID=A0AAP4FCI5_9CORY|nr:MULTISPECIES: YbaB/EbfC family nucleoid-associated protein [Corynebacterium]MCG7242890.1 YbaB/EbfC family nucleoid-associated protein [Corynebacterium sp. ACRPS]MCG7272666.1 YbaB/EbfC family nucleoid-associated protein [Corynebacterium sp. ACRQM]EEI14770.1 DNA-binding protein, YbaB/EbfC family [Corynebacterium accolens ATCC 49725]EFM44635.1 DNA-binding protein, YbaB/EbfC family [Corynebacterium accolens ATCC 49726]ERS43351.1 YbaB/EbfC family DNA-binding protein [Corynebacterium sp. KPL1996]